MSINNRSGHSGHVVMVMWPFISFCLYMCGHFVNNVVHTLFLLYTIFI